MQNQEQLRGRPADDITRSLLPFIPVFWWIGTWLSRSLSGLGVSVIVYRYR